MHERRGVGPEYLGPRTRYRDVVVPGERRIALRRHRKSHAIDARKVRAQRRDDEIVAGKNGARHRLARRQPEHANPNAVTLQMVCDTIPDSRP